MTAFALGLLLATVMAIAKEHADRQKTVKALVFIPGEKPDYLKWLAVNKSWWEQIQERLKTIAMLSLVAVLTWLALQIAGA